MSKRSRKNRWQVLQEKRGYTAESHERGTEANERGQRNENRVWICLDSIGTPAGPSWAKSARKATEAEDKGGVDFVVHTDVGTVYLQVKSSHSGANEFLKNHRAARELPVGVVIVLENTTDEGLREQVFFKLTMLRERVMGVSLDRQRQRLVSSLNCALRAAINQHGPIDKETARTVAIDIANHLKGWLEREIGMREHDAAPAKETA